MDIRSKGIVLNKNKLWTLLGLYIVGIFAWDYTIIYQLLLVLMVGASFLLFKAKIPLNSTYLKCSGLLIVYFTFHTIVGLSVNPSLSYEYLLTMVINWCAALATINILANRNVIERIMKICIYVAFVVCIYIIMVDHSNLFTGTLGGNVYKPFFSSKYAHNEVAALAGLSTLFISYFRINGKRIRHPIAMTVFFAVFVLLTGARKSFLFVIVGAIIYPYFFSGKKEGTAKRLWNVLFAVAALIIIIYLVMENSFLYNTIGYRFAGYFSGLRGGEFTESSAISRSVMKRTALSLIKEKPFVGYGLNTFRTFQGSFGTWSHINYLELCVSGGVIAIIMYYIFFVKSFLFLIKKRTDIMGGMFLSLLLYLLVYDYLSVSYLSRFMILMLCMIEAYIMVCGKEDSMSAATIT